MDPLDLGGLLFFLVAYGIVLIKQYRERPDEFQIIREFYKSQG
jgi:hypothetical protein